MTSKIEKMKVYMYHETIDLAVYSNEKYPHTYPRYVDTEGTRSWCYTPSIYDNYQRRYRGNDGTSYIRHVDQSERIYKNMKKYQVEDYTQEIVYARRYDFVILSYHPKQPHIQIFFHINKRKRNYNA